MMLLAVLIGCGVGFVIGIQYSDEFSESAPKLTPSTSDGNKESTVADTKEEQPYWYKVGQPDIFPVWLTAVITAFVGGIALATLGTIGRQSELMKEQSDTSRQKERPRLRIELDDLDFSLTESPDMILIGCRVINYGGSAAFLCGDIYGCWIGETREAGNKEHEGIPMHLPEVLVPGEKSYDPAMILPDEKEVVAWTLWGSDDPRIERLRKGEFSVYLSGFINYENIFDETWSLGFKRKFTVQHYEEKGFSIGRWSREGDADNYERQILPANKGPKVTISG